MSTDSVSYTVREFITNHFSQARKRNLKDDDPLLETGVVDSLGVLDLVSFIETEFVVTVDDEELTPDHFNSIARITAYVQSKRK